MSVISGYGYSSHIIQREIYSRDEQQQWWINSSGGNNVLWLKSRNANTWIEHRRNREALAKKNKRNMRVEAFWPDLSKPTVLEMEPINDSDHLDQILLAAQHNSHPILIDWMASWCRKCIYLKPKLEKLAAEYHNKVKFYCVDVNKVPQSLVKRGNISNMPTIQLWKDGEMKAEVIGGHKAWLVIEEVREMIQKFI